MTYSQEYYRKNKERHLKLCKKYYLEDKENHKKRTIKWQKDHPEAVKEIRQKAYLKNKEQCNKRTRAYTKKRKEQVLRAYGGKNPKCCFCKITDLDILTLDHIFNDGGVERKKLGLSGAGFYGWLIKNNYPNKDRFQILCQNCNIKKYHNLRKSL